VLCSSALCNQQLLQAAAHTTRNTSNTNHLNSSFCKQQTICWLAAKHKLQEQAAQQQLMLGQNLPLAEEHSQTPARHKQRQTQEQAAEHLTPTAPKRGCQPEHANWQALEASR
jgi:hypothetical protein